MKPFSYAIQHKVSRTFFNKGIKVTTAALLLTGCATAYQPMGAMGGFDEAQLNEQTFRVSFKGNGYTSSEKAQDMTLLRSAELCLQAGYTSFVLLADRSDVKNESVWLSNTSVRRGNIFSSGTTLNFSSPSTTNVVSCVTEKQQKGFVYSALVIYEGMTKKYNIPRSSVRFLQLQREAELYRTPSEPSPR